MRKGKRLKEVKLRKNFFPALVIIIFLWGIISGLVYFVDPETFGAILLFFILSFFAMLLTLSLVFANSRRGFIASVGLIIFLVLRYLGIGNILNFLLITGISITIELYFSRKWIESFDLLILPVILALEFNQTKCRENLGSENKYLPEKSNNKNLRPASCWLKRHQRVGGFFAWFFQRERTRDFCKTIGGCLLAQKRQKLH